MVDVGDLADPDVRLAIGRGIGLGAAQGLRSAIHSQSPVVGLVGNGVAEVVLHEQGAEALGIDLGVPHNILHGGQVGVDQTLADLLRLQIQPAARVHGKGLHQDGAILAVEFAVLIANGANEDVYHRPAGHTHKEAVSGLQIGHIPGENVLLAVRLGQLIGDLQELGGLHSGLQKGYVLLDQSLIK